jgi:hypothetical protein
LLSQLLSLHDSPPSPTISTLLINQLLHLYPSHVLYADPLLDDIKACYLKTLNSIASHYLWPRMTRTVKSYVSSCATYQRSLHLGSSNHMVFQ